MNHKLQLTRRTDPAAGQLILDVTGCLTHASYLILLKRLHQLRRRQGGGTVTVDVQGVRHLDPQVLLSLRRHTMPGGITPVPLQLAEPVELPVCLAHVGPDGEVLAHLNGHSGRRHSGITSPARPQARVRTAGRKAARNPRSGRLRTVIELPSEIYDGTLDPDTTVLALSDTALELLVDALYRQLDSAVPWFGAYTWYELALDELQNRRGNGERAHPVLRPGEVPAGKPARRVPARGGL